MTEAAIADKLSLTGRSVIWVVGDSVEETALLEPLPLGAETVDEPDERMNAVVLVADTRAGLLGRLDEVLPAIGSAPLVWVSYPAGESGVLDRSTVEVLVGEYGWGTGPEVRLDDTWAAVRLRPL